MSASFKEIAERCGLPIHTVARVLNDAAQIDEDVRSRVLSAAAELGYSSEGAGKGSNTHHIGVLFVDESYSGLTHPFFASMLNAFKEQAESRGYDITFINHNIGAESATYLEHCRYRGVDGVCLACVDFYSKEVEELMNSDIPCVTVDHPWPTLACVLSDNSDAMRMLVDYAVSLGHRRIAFVSGQRNSEVTEERIRQYHENMKAHHLDVPNGYYLEGRYGDTALTRELVSRLLERSDRPSCILLPDDSCYFGAQEAVREHELRIPADISLAGFDGIGLTQSLRPKLTTIRQDSEEMGRQAAIRLIERIEHPESATAERVKIPVTLLKGETVGWCEEW